MTPSEAIQELDAMQRQIIHGSRIFGDIADVIRALQLKLAKANETIAALNESEIDALP